MLSSLCGFLGTQVILAQNGRWTSCSGCAGYQPGSRERAVAWRQRAMVRLVLRRTKLSCKTRASGEVVVPSPGSCSARTRWEILLRLAGVFRDVFGILCLVHTTIPIPGLGVLLFQSGRQLWYIRPVKVAFPLSPAVLLRLLFYSLELSLGSPRN